LVFVHLADSAKKDSLLQRRSLGESSGYLSQHIQRRGFLVVSILPQQKKGETAVYEKTENSCDR
jgi:hypothetical protein